MPLKTTHGRNGNHNNVEAKSNGHGEEDSSNSDCDSSLCELYTENMQQRVLYHFLADDEAEAERRKVDCLDDMQYLEQQFSDLKELYVYIS